MAERPFGVFVIGEGPLGQGTVRAISQQEGFKVTGVMSATDDRIREEARQASIPSLGYKELKDHNFPWVVGEELGSDLVVLANTRRKIPMDILNAGSVGFGIEGHNSLLSLYRGPSAANWPIVNGERISGFTVFRVDEGWDTGDIAEQAIIPIGPNDTAAGYYLGKVVPREIQATMNVIRSVADGSVQFLPQWASPFHADKRYEREFTKADGYVDFNHASQWVHDQIRGSDATPAASASINGMEVDLFDSRIGERTDSEPGTLVRVDVRLAAVATKDGITVNLGRLRQTGTKDKIPAHDFLTTNGFKVGDKFEKITA